MARVRAVLFDVEGTLLDSNDAHARSWLDVLRGHGKDVPLDLVRSKIGIGGDKLLMQLVGLEEDCVQARLLSERRQALFKAYYLPDLAPLRGGRQLVERLGKSGFTCAVVAPAAAAEVRDLLREAAVANLFSLIVTTDDVDASTSDPDPRLTLRLS